MKPIITFEDFSKIDIRIGTIIEVNDFLKAKKQAYQLKVDFGNLGIKNSSAQITKLYSKEELIGLKVTAVVNFRPRQIANFSSEILILGIQNGEKVILLQNLNGKIKNGEQVT